MDFADTLLFALSIAHFFLNSENNIFVCICGNICTQRLPGEADPFGKALSVFAFHIPPFWVEPFGPTLYSSSVLMFIVVDIGFGAVCTLGCIAAPIGIWIIGN